MYPGLLNALAANACDCGCRDTLDQQLVSPDTNHTAQNARSCPQCSERQHYGPHLGLVLAGLQQVGGVVPGGGGLLAADVNDGKALRTAVVETSGKN